MFISITTNKKEVFMTRESVIKTLWNKLLDRSRKDSQGDVIIKGYDVDIPLEDFLAILKEYKSKYTR